MKPLLYVEYRQVINAIKVTLRTPKRLIPTLFFIAYMVFYGFGQFALRSHHQRMPQPVPLNGLPADVIQSILLFITIWISIGVISNAFSNSLIIYSPAEMDVLIGTPIGRRLVMGLKLGTLYAKVGLYLAFFGIFFVPQMTLSYGLPSPGRALVGWIALVLYAATIINIATVVNLVVACSGEEKRWQKRSVQALGLGVLVLAVTTVYGTYVRTGDVGSAIAALIHQPVLVSLAAPAVWMSGLALSLLRGWQPAYAWQLPALALLALGTMAVVLARKENPYEPSLAASARRATIRRAVKSGDLGTVRAEMLRNRKQSATTTIVAPFGRGATAILWKNMLISMRTNRVVIIGVAIIIPAAALIGRSLVKDPRSLQFAPYVMVGVTLYMTWILAMAMQQMLRADLKQVNILKPMPVSPWWLMVAETANTGLMVWAFIWLLFGSAIFLLGVPVSPLLIIAALSLPFVGYASICSQTTVAVLYPNWQDMSQQWIANLLSMGLSMLSVGPPVAIGAVFYMFHVPAYVTAPAVILSSLVLAVAGISLGSVTYRRHDPTDE